MKIVTLNLCGSLDRAAFGEFSSREGVVVLKDTSFSTILLKEFSLVLKQMILEYCHFKCFL